MAGQSWPFFKEFNTAAA